MKGRELTRANYFAKADVGSPEQRAIVEQYLLDPQRQPGELEKFAGLFPSENKMLSKNLLTKSQTRTQADIATSDLAALAVVEQWRADPRFEGVRLYLEAIHLRLGQFVKQAGTDGR